MPCRGGIYTDGKLTVANSTFSGNSAQNGGAIFIRSGMVDISSSTFLDNSASNAGGGILNWTGSMKVTNSTFSGNSANQGGGIYNDVSSLTLKNSTFSGNSATTGSGLYNAGSLDFFNNLLANASSGEDCFNEDGAGVISTNDRNLVEFNAATPNNCGTPTLISDPKLGPLDDNGGLTRTLALLPGSPAINAGDDTSCVATDQRGVTRPQGVHCDMGAYEANGSLDVSVGGLPKGSYFMVPNQSKRVSYSNVNQGPVQVVHTNPSLIIAAERVIYNVNHLPTSFSEMMALPGQPAGQHILAALVQQCDLDTQLRFGNVSNTTATVQCLDWRTADDQRLPREWLALEQSLYPARWGEPAGELYGREQWSGEDRE